MSKKSRSSGWDRNLHNFNNRYHSQTKDRYPKRPDTSSDDGEIYTSDSDEIDFTGSTPDDERVSQDKKPLDKSSDKSSEKSSEKSSDKSSSNPFLNKPGGKPYPSHIDASQENLKAHVSKIPGKPSENPPDKASKQPSDRSSKQVPRNHSKPLPKPPSKQPSKQPSDKSSKQPLDKSSRPPSKQPSDKSSKPPSKQPSDKSSKRPSKQPSDKSSKQPSKQPSDKSSKHPSKQPSKQRSYETTSTRFASKKPSSRGFRPSGKHSDIKSKSKDKEPDDTVTLSGELQESEVTCSPISLFFIDKKKGLTEKSTSKCVDDRIIEASLEKSKRTTVSRMPKREVPARFRKREGVPKHKNRRGPHIIERSTTPNDRDINNEITSNTSPDLSENNGLSKTRKPGKQRSE